ncbi:MAG: hypothetical protein ACLQU1_27675 [Bryobacteraceae bacterium]
MDALGPRLQGGSGPAAGRGAGSESPRGPGAGIVMRAGWRTSGSARQQPQETGEPSTNLLPHHRTGRAPPRGRTLPAHGSHGRRPPRGGELKAQRRAGFGAGGRNAR